jgi:hypothetical protein
MKRRAPWRGSISLRFAKPHPNATKSRSKEIQVREPPSEEHPDGRLVVVKRETSTKRVFDWQAAAWWLERRRAGDYQKKLTAEVAAMQAQIDEIKKSFADQPRPAG